jgi:branched-chain amino acid transport system ATP-binding protein
MAEPVLAVRGLSRRFGALKAADAINLDLRAGEIHALIGPNGAGKSSFIGLVCGTLAPDAGTIALMGADISRLGAPGRARAGLARTFQVSSLLAEFSALRNVMLAVQARQGTSFRFLRPVESDASLTGPALEMLERVGLGGRAEMPAAALSHGERRQLELAMALAARPRALLLDEPMAGLGPEGSRAMTALLGPLRESVPMLLVEHDMDAVFALADRVSVLVYGRIIASGTPEAVRSDPEVRKAYLGDMA